MTQNQIRYWEMQEARRSNRANESLKSREVAAKEIEAEANATQRYNSIAQGYLGLLTSLANPLSRYLSSGSFRRTERRY